MTTNEIVTALRCISAPAGDKKANCESCPFYAIEKLDEEWREKTGMDEWTSCDCDAVGFAAADALEQLLDRCARYAEEIAVLQERQRWIPVMERLPEDGERVLSYCKDRVIHDAKWSWPQNAWFDKVTGHEYFESFVTHWMPLPDAPEVE